jgi:hypothetical protein
MNQIIDDDDYEPLSATPPGVASASRRSDDNAGGSVSSLRLSHGGGSGSITHSGPVPIMPSSHGSPHHSPRHQPRQRDDTNLYSPTVLTHPVPGSLANSVSFSNAPPLTPISDRQFDYRQPSSPGGGHHQMTMPASHSSAANGSSPSPGGRHSPRSQSMNANDMTKASLRRPITLSSMTTKGPSAHPRLMSLDCVR